MRADYIPVWLAKPVEALDDDKPRRPDRPRRVPARRAGDRRARRARRRLSRLVPDVEGRRVTGFWLRHQPAGGLPLARRDPPPDNRWQRGDVVDALYLADAEATVWAEWYRHLAERGLPPATAMPRDLWRWSRRRRGRRPLRRGAARGGRAPAAAARGGAAGRRSRRWGRRSRRRAGRACWRRARRGRKGATLCLFRGPDGGARARGRCRRRAGSTRRRRRHRHAHLSGVSGRIAPSTVSGVSVCSATSPSRSVRSAKRPRAPARKSRAPARPGSASRSSPPGASSRGRSGSATGDVRLRVEDVGRQDEVVRPAGDELVAVLGPVRVRGLAGELVEREAVRGEDDGVRAPVGGQHLGARARGDEARQREPAAELEHARARGAAGSASSARASAIPLGHSRAHQGTGRPANASSSRSASQSTGRTTWSRRGSETRTATSSSGAGSDDDSTPRRAASRSASEARRAASAAVIGCTVVPADRRVRFSTVGGWWRPARRRTMGVPWHGCPSSSPSHGRRRRRLRGRGRRARGRAARGSRTSCSSSPTTWTGACCASCRRSGACGATGMTLERFYVADSLCCTSRASMLAGRYPHNTRVRTNVLADGRLRARGRSTTAPGRASPSALSAAGYRTGMFGKYLNGYPADRPPDPGWTRVAGRLGRLPRLRVRASPTTARRCTTAMRPTDYATDVIARGGERFIRESVEAGDPFMVQLATFTPHTPTVAAPRHAGLLQHAQSADGRRLRPADQRPADDGWERAAR